MGLVATFLAACRSSSKNEYARPTRYDFMSAHDTSQGKLYNVIENWPDIRTLEMSWVKMHEGGRIIANARRRGETFTTRGHFLLNTRSRIHTHTTGGDSIFDKQLATIPSPLDISNFLHDALNHANHPERFVRVSHVIPISTQGKVVGIVTLRIGKKLLATMQTDMNRIIQEGDISAITQSTSRVSEMIRLLKKVDKMEKKYDDGVTEAEPFFVEYRALLAQLQQAGMQFRTTPRKGYTFKDGYFQPKA